jgi:hypothetical protein
VARWNERPGVAQNISLHLELSPVTASNERVYKPALGICLRIAATKTAAIQPQRLGSPGRTALVRRSGAMTMRLNQPAARALLNPSAMRLANLLMAGPDVAGDGGNASLFGTLASSTSRASIATCNASCSSAISAALLGSQLGLSFTLGNETTCDEPIAWRGFMEIS